MRRIFELVREGASIRETAERVTSETGRRWHPTAVARIVRREDYKRGRDKLIDPRVWNAAQRALASRRRRSAA